MKVLCYKNIMNISPGTERVIVLVVVVIIIVLLIWMIFVNNSSIIIFSSKEFKPKSQTIVYKTLDPDLTH